MRLFKPVVISIALASAGPAWAQYTDYYLLVNSGLANTSGGYGALTTDLTLSCTIQECGSNTAIGSNALTNNQAAFANTAVGAYSLEGNVTGVFNTGIGVGALAANTTGVSNTAVGAEAASSQTTAVQNTAVGGGAMGGNGSSNTALGYEALGGYNDSTSSANLALGVFALLGNTTGSFNVAAGTEALTNNTSGGANLAFGPQALYSNTIGSNNIGVGYAGGYSLTTGSNNIDIGNDGVAAESGAIRIGTPSKQTAVYIAGITSVPVAGSGVAVVVNSKGQLGIQGSSERYKTAIKPMGDTTSKLEQLQPVTFKYKSDPQRATQYGLIAEQVARVYPELVVRDATGRIISVRYDELAPMLLNEMHQENRRLVEQDEQIHELKDAVRKLQEHR